MVLCASHIAFGRTSSKLICCRRDSFLFSKQRIYIFILPLLCKEKKEEYKNNLDTSAQNLHLDLNGAQWTSIWQNTSPTHRILILCSIQSKAVTSIIRIVKLVTNMLILPTSGNKHILLGHPRSVPTYYYIPIKSKCHIQGPYPIAN